MSFVERFDSAVERSGSLLCVGLDPPGGGTAAEAQRACERVIDETLDLACAYKANLAFFEQFGSSGYRVLEQLRGRVPDQVLYVLDGKRGDIGSSAEAYARALFDVLGADAVTVNPLQGRDAVAPFLAREGRAAFLLTRTSNAGAADFLDATLAGGDRLYERIVDTALGWDHTGDIGFVVGATEPAAVAAVRARAPEAPLLLPGVGAQGGPLDASLAAALSGRRGRVLVASSRAIALAPEGAAAAAAKLCEAIEAVRQATAPA